jgi:hypothetical protein
MPVADATTEQLEEFVDSIVTAGLGPLYLDYLTGKPELTETERKVLRMIQRHPRKQE